MSSDEDSTHKILIWSVGGGALLVLLIVLVICCSLCKRRDGYWLLARPKVTTLSIDHSFYESFRQFEEYKIDDDEIKFEKELGSGSFGTVHFAKYRGAEVAVKVMRLPLEIRQGSETFITETLTLSKLRNRHIVQFIGVNISNEYPWIVMEFMQGGSVADKIHRELRQLDWKTILKWALDAAKGMEFLHAFKPHPILHRDLKSDNLLVDENGVVKVGDFGTAKLMSRITTIKSTISRTKAIAINDPTSSTFSGTVPWAAPEVIPPKPPARRGKFTTASDVYSYGITLWEMISNKKPFRGYNFEFQIMDEILKGVRPEIPQHCPHEMAEFLRECWQVDVQRRPTFEKIHKTFENLLAEILLSEDSPDNKGRKTYPQGNKGILGRAAKFL